MINKIRLIINKILRVKYFVTALLVGVIFLLGGILAFNAKDTMTSKSEATITSIVKGDYDELTESYSYTVSLTYKDELGKEHNVTTDSYDYRWKEESIITISYDPENPENINTGTISLKIISYILIAVGTVIIITGIRKLIIVLKTPTEKTNEFNKVKMDKVSEEEIKKIKNSNEDKKEYYFYCTQGFKPNYIMDTNPERKKIMEAQNLKLSLFSNYKFNFINYLTKKEELKSCGHTVTSGIEEDSLGINMNADFKIDGQNCWDFLGKMGYSIEPEIKKFHAIYKVKKYGEEIAIFEQAGTNIITKKNYKWGNIPTKGIYKISCRESDIEGIFYCCFVIARTFDL